MLPLGPLYAVALGFGSSPSCQPSFPTQIAGRALEVAITGGNQGTPADRIPITYMTPTVFTVSAEALDQNGNLDTSFTGYVRFSMQPGTVIAVSGPNTDGLNVELINGVANDVAVSVIGAYGDAQIWVEDLGYVPIDPAGVALPDGGVRLPECANGIDDNDNGLVDYGVDPGCYAPNDDTEDGGSYAGAASGVIHFAYPKIADVNGINNNGAGTPFPSEAVQIDTEWNGTTYNTPNGIVVTGVASTGFFVTDIAGSDAYASVYAFTYSAPPLMNVCDRLITFGGTASDFFGFTEVNYPTWSLEEWDPAARPCLVPEPTALTIDDLSSTSSKATVLAPLEAGLVRVPAADGSTIAVANLLGPGLIPYTTAADGTVTIGTITADATSCDYEGTGKIDFNNAAEAACEDACEANVQCSEYSQYAGQSQFQLVVTNGDGSSRVAITADGSASPEFNPVSLRGTQLLAFTGNLLFFSGGSQFTIQARCADDIVAVGGKILPSSPPWPTPTGQAQPPAACVVSLSNQAASN